MIGDARHIGLAGAALATPDSVHTAIENPANANFSEWAASLSLLNDYVRDDRMNFDGRRRRGVGTGVVASSPRFGIFLGHRLPSQESSPEGTVEVQETHLGAAYGFGDRFSFGVAAVAARADWKGFEKPTTHASAWSAAFGGRFRLDERWMLGVAYRPGIPIQDPDDSSYRSRVEVPSRLVTAVTFAPDSPFKFHFGLSVYGSQKETVELADPSLATARVLSFQPRLGIEYAAYRKDHVHLDLYAGAYFEPARIDGLSTRTHLTGGASLKAWAGRASVAFDRASGYSNFIAGIGIDLLDLAVQVKLIPLPKSGGKNGADEQD